MQIPAKNDPNGARVMDISALPEAMHAYVEQVLLRAGWRRAHEDETAHTALTLSGMHGWQLMRDGQKIADIRLPVRAGVFMARLSRLQDPKWFLPEGDIVFQNGCRLVPQESVFVLADQQAVRLTEKEVAILLFLYAEGGRAVTREKLLENVWAYAPDVETHTLETHIYRLRQKIEPVPSVPTILLTIENGYALGVTADA